MSKLNYNLTFIDYLYLLLVSPIVLICFMPLLASMIYWFIQHLFRTRILKQREIQETAFVPSKDGDRLITRYRYEKMEKRKEIRLEDYISR